jgi:hypothetical protein
MSVTAASMSTEKTPDLVNLVVRFANPALLEAAKHKFKGTTKESENQKDGTLSSRWEEGDLTTQF